jgi:mRNA interferase RelE/StbE
MVWRIEFEREAERDLNQLDKPQRHRILVFLSERLSHLANPRSIGEALRGSTLEKFWKYRVGDFRIITLIEDERLLIMVLRVGHRKNVYKKTPTMQMLKKKSRP